MGLEVRDGLCRSWDRLADLFALDPRNFPKGLIGSESGPLLIVGCGRNVWEEVNGLPENRHVMAVNDMGMYWPGYVRHWYSNDVYKLVHWAQGRRDRHVHLYGKPERLHSCFSRGTAPGVYHWPFPGQGSSGLVSILVALALGYDPITIAGLPFDNSGHFYDPPNGHNLSKGAPWSNFEAETPDRLLERSAPLMRGKVRALSGRLRGYLD